MTAIRLREGFHLFPLDERQWALFGPDDNWIRLNADPQDVALLADRLRPDHPATPNPELTPGLAQLLDALADAGIICMDASPAPSIAAPPSTLWHRGEGRLGAAVGALMSALALPAKVWPATQELPDAAIAGDVLLDVAAWQPLRRWLALDQNCCVRRLAWYGCHGEGERIFAGPLLHPDSILRYAEMQTRRRASADHPQELQAYLDYVEQSDLRAPAISTVAAVQLAATIVSDVLLHWQGKGASRAPLWQHSIGVSEVSLRHHPILPIPSGLAT